MLFRRPRSPSGAAALFAVTALMGACASDAAVVRCPTPSAEGSLPPPDEQLARWRAIHRNGDAPPDGTRAAALLPELFAYLGSPDPERRDGIGYEVLHAWIKGKPRLSPAEIRELVVPALIDNLGRPLDEPDGVFRRSFSALVLSVVVARDLADPVLDDAGRRALLAAASAYAAREDDLRGFIGQRGWLHAAAHTADLLKLLAREPTLSDDERARILDAVAALVTRAHGFNFHHGEDGRLAQAAVEALRRGAPDARVDAWLAVLVAPLEAAADPASDAAAYAAQRNARNFLFTLFVQLSLEPSPSDTARRTLERLRAIFTA